MGQNERILSRKAALALLTLCLMWSYNSQGHAAQCSDESAAKFTSGGFASKILFENQTSDRLLSIYKVIEDGNRVFVMSLTPRSSMSMFTVTTEPWVVVDQRSGVCIFVFRSDGDTLFPITNDNVDAALKSPSRVVFQAAPSPEPPVAKNDAPKATIPTALLEQLNQPTKQPVDHPAEQQESPPTESYARQLRRDCEHVARECHKNAQRYFKWYMSFFHREELAFEDYDRELVRAVKERKESDDECSDHRNKCLSEISDGD